MKHKFHDLKSTLNLISIFVIAGAYSCKTRSEGAQAPESQIMSDFGENPEALEQVKILGDFANDFRNRWWNRRSDLALYKEFVAQDNSGSPGKIDGKTEAELFAEGVSLTKAAQTQNNGNKTLRTFHAKGQVCLKGKLKVETFSKAEDQELAFGIFKEPKTYEIWGRFSNGNGNGNVQSDAANDPRGFAIKVLDVPGQPFVSDMPDPVLGRQPAEGFMNQDFLGTNSPVFPTRNAKTYLEFHEATLKGGLALIQFFASIPQDGPRTADVLRQWIDRDVGSLADITYGSGGAFKMGTRAGKYWMTACDGNQKTQKPADPGQDYLRDELRNRLQSRGEVCMKLEAQIQRHPLLHPIEDPSVLWKNIPADVDIREFNSNLNPNLERNRSAKFFKLASISFPKEGNEDAFDDARQKTCEALFFNTWHTLAEHKPLGNINRIRLHVYRASFINRTANSAEVR